MSSDSGSSSLRGSGELDGIAEGFETLDGAALDALGVAGVEVVGAVLGVAIARTVAVARSGDYLAANEGANPLVVLNEGIQSAFVARVVLAVIGMALALVLLGRPRTATYERLEPVPATVGGE
jgi:hypothetical protein